jgi:hypothetical protein
MRGCEVGDDQAEHDELRALTDRDHDRDPSQDGGGGEPRAR